MTLFASQLGGAGQTGRPPLSLYNTGSTWSRNGFYLKDVSVPSPQTGWSTVINITGQKGFATFLALYKAADQSPQGTASLRYTIDGGTAITVSYTQMPRYRSLCAIGSIYTVDASQEEDEVLPTFEAISFESSFVVEVSNTAGIDNSGRFDLLHKIWRTE